MAKRTAEISTGMLSDHRLENLAMALAEALEAAYLVGRPEPYRVPCHVDGDLFHFEKVKSEAKARETIRSAARDAVLRATSPAS